MRMGWEGIVRMGWEGEQRALFVDYGSTGMSMGAPDAVARARMAYRLHLQAHADG